ncbi:MAG: hypothetical protein ACRDNE_16715 [Gaiellaceae bacterium]
MSGRPRASAAKTVAEAVLDALDDRQACRAGGHRDGSFTPWEGLRPRELAPALLGVLGVGLALRVPESEFV